MDHNGRTVKNWIWLGALLVLLGGCARRSVEEVRYVGFQRTEITVEAGVQPDVGAFYDDAQMPEDVTLQPELTEEQLRTAGASYGLDLCRGGVSIPVTVRVADRTPPVITGPDSLTVVEGDPIPYRDGVTLTDNADGEVQLYIGDEDVDPQTPGQYTVRYTAVDSSGNTAEKLVSLTIKERPRMADELAEMLAAGLQRSTVTVEAGSTLDVGAFFEPGPAPEDAVLTPTLTEEQLRTAGASYELTLECAGKKGIALVNIADTTPPVISGARDLTIHVGDSVSYREGIELTDNSVGNVTLTIDNADVDMAKEGEYPVCYVATDSSGNSAQEWIMLYIVEASDEEMMATVDKLADKLIDQLISDDMSKWDICRTLWQWCHYHIEYSYTAGARTLYDGAYEGLYKRKGDCYAYYATFTVLLQKCGIDTIKVTRVGGTSNHWWNLVNLGDGWYHCDCSPRRKGDHYDCFMQTDAQVQAYTESYKEHPNYYTFDGSLYPERATKIVYGK